MERMVRKRLKIVCYIAGTLFLIGFIWYSIGLYQKKAEELAHTTQPWGAV